MLLLWYYIYKTMDLLTIELKQSFCGSVSRSIEILLCKTYLYNHNEGSIWVRRTEIFRVVEMRTASGTCLQIILVNNYFLRWCVSLSFVYSMTWRIFTHKYISFKISGEKAQITIFLVADISHILLQMWKAINIEKIFDYIL